MDTQQVKLYAVLQDDTNLGITALGMVIDKKPHLNTPDTVILDGFNRHSEAKGNRIVSQTNDASDYINVFRSRWAHILPPDKVVLVASHMILKQPDQCMASSYHAFEENICDALAEMHLRNENVKSMSNPVAMMIAPDPKAHTVFNLCRLLCSGLDIRPFERLIKKFGINEQDIIDSFNEIRNEE